MKIAIPTEGNRKLSDRVATTFSRAPTFTIVTVEDGKTRDSTVIENRAASYKQGAGPLAVSTLKDHGVTALIASDVGPGASTILNALEIKVYSTEAGKKVKNVLDDWLDQ
ncbi:MAG: NifB/NifX family molybdenum-iron cluster-binding protein [Candidatus Bathyarchaeota archaeon]|nr:NifB/NifX family molybdenum-iron cluster-binding protein [Candidatus Bathyarchaeota archaeon]